MEPDPNWMLYRKEKNNKRTAKTPKQLKVQDRKQEFPSVLPGLG